MAGRGQKQNTRLSLSLSLLSPRKKSVTPSKSVYISKPLNSYGPSGESLGIHTDDVIPLRVYTEIFGPSLHYKSVGVNRNTSATVVIESIIQKMSRVANEERSYSPTEFCLVEMCVLPEFSYFRLLGESTPPLHFYQQHSKRYTNTDAWRLKLILKSHIKSTADLILHSSKRDASLIGVAVECNCLEDTFLYVYFHLPGYTTCERVINKIISEFAYERQPDDFTLFCPSIHTTARDPLPNGLNLEFVLKQSKTQVLELALRFRYDDYGEDGELTDTEEPVNAPATTNDEPTLKHSEHTDDTEDTWVEYYDSAREKIYYVNSNTEEVMRVHPATQQDMYLDSDMPPGWVRGVDEETGRVYYRNTFDKKIEWSHPLRHLERIYKRSLQPIATTSLPRPSVTPPTLHKPPSRTPPPVPRSARPSLLPAELNQVKTGIQSSSLHSSNQSFPDMERASSDALLSEFFSVSNKDKTHIRKNKRLNALRRLLVDKYSPDSDNLSLGSGHRLKSFFTTSKKQNTSTTFLDGVTVRVTPNPSPAGRKKSIISLSSNISEKSLSSLPRNKKETPGESYGSENQSNGIGGPIVRSVSEQDQTQSAVTALDEAFSLLDNLGSEREEIYENKNAQLEEKERKTEDSLNDCFQIIDSSFDEGSDLETMDYPTVVVADTDRLVDSVDSNEHLEVFSPVKEGDATFDTESSKVSFEHNVYGENNLRDTSMNALVVEGNESLDNNEMIQRPASVSSLSSGDLGSQRSEEGSTSGRSKLRTRKGRMSRNTSALNHQELEQLNKGIEPVQKSILKQSRNDLEDENNHRKVKGVTFLSSAVQMIEIERRRNSESSDTPSLDTQSVIHRRGAGNWRNMLKTFYDEVDNEKGDNNLMWSPDEGIGLVEEEYLHEANKLTREQELPHIVTDQNEEEPIHSLKSEPVTHAPLLPPRPTSDDLAASATSSPSLPDSEGSLPPSTPKHTNTSDVTQDRSTDSTRHIYTSFSDSFKDSSTVDNSGVTDSGMFSLEVSTNLSPRSEDLSQSLTQLVFDSLSGTLADTTEVFPRSEQTPESGEEPVVVSSLVVPVTPNIMVPMDVFLPKERPSLPREQLTPRTLSKEEVPSLIEQVPSPTPHSPTGPSKHLQALSDTRSASPILVDQLNKPLSGTPFIYGYQYQRKPADKSATLYSGYLALVNQQSELESKQKMKQTN